MHLIKEAKYIIICVLTVILGSIYLFTMYPTPELDHMQYYGVSNKKYYFSRWKDRWEENLEGIEQGLEMLSQ